MSTERFIDWGQTENEWFNKTAWFTIIENAKSLKEARIKKQEIKELSTVNQGLYSQQEREGLKHAIKAKDEIYFYAFPRAYDAFILIEGFPYMGWHPSFNSLPQNIYAMHAYQLRKRFPIDNVSSRELVIFSGEIVCQDYRFLRNPGVASVATEIGLDHFPVEDWDKYSYYGFKFGMSLVRLTSKESVFRLDSELILENRLLRIDSSEQVENAEVRVEKHLLELIQAKYGKIPNQA